MTKRLYVVAVLVLCAGLAFAGGKGKMTDRSYRGASDAEESAPSKGSGQFVPRPATAVGAAASVGTYIGLEGYYDFQNNGGVAEFLRADSASGMLHAVYMIAPDSTPNYPDRWTVYASSKTGGTTWNAFGNANRVPAIRSGFPSLDLLAGPTAPGSPIIANHNVGGGVQNSTFMYLGDTSGAFTELSALPPLSPPDPTGTEPIWPHLTSGSNGELLTIGSVNWATGTTGLYGAFLNRSTDYGTTWLDPWVRVPMLSCNGGRYTLQSNRHGRIGVLASGDSIVLWESTNDGSTWLQPVPLFRDFQVVGGESLGFFNQGTFDMTYRGNEPLVTFPVSRELQDSSITYAGSRILVWSPTLGYKVAVPWDSLLYPSSLVTNAFHQVIGYPVIAMSGSRIVVAYQASLANTNTDDPLSGGRKFSEIFLTVSTDGGNSWTLPVNLTKTPQVDERYPSISKWNPDGFVYLSWQEKGRAGSSVRGEGLKALAKAVFYKANLTTLFPANDITALAVTSPNPSIAIKQGTSFSPKAVFRNIGLAGQSGIPVRYDVLDSSGASVYTNSTTIPSLASTVAIEVTFGTVGGTLTPGLYRTRAVVWNSGDVFPENDTTFNTVVVSPVVPVTATYFNDFEDTAPGIGAFGWYGAVIGGGTSDWVRGRPAKPQQITGPWSGTKCFVTKLTGNYTDNLESFLGSPIFDLSSVTGMVRVEFYHNFVVEPNWDGMWLEYSTNAGINWNVADHAVGSGSTWNTGMSTGWYNAVVDSGISPGAPPPPMWGDSTVLYTPNTNGWIKSTTMIPVGGYSDVRLRWHLSADANQNREGWAIDDVTLKVGSGTVSVPYTLGWNMISNPVQKPAGQDSVLQLYPASAFNYVFGFGTSGYFQTRTMGNGPGYWAKFNSAGSASLSGSRLLSLSAPVNAGWNMIGSMTTTVDTANVYPSPYGSRLSIYFKYNNGYFEAATLEPGKAYWVKASAPGAFLYLPPAPGAPAPKTSANPLAQLNTLTVKDAAGNGTTLYFGGVDEGQVDVSMYEMPPVPPQGAFDARFETAEAGYMVQTHEKGALTGEFPVRLQSAVYPVTVSWNIVSDAGYRLTDGMGNKAFGAKELRGTGSMVVRNNGVSRLVVGIGGEAIPTEYALLQNYPNPFNPSTTIKFALPEPSRVTVEIYNLLGQRVNTLMSEGLGAGYHEVKWNGTASSGQAVGSGVYFVRFSADGVEGATFSDIRKVMLMK